MGLINCLKYTVVVVQYENYIVKVTVVTLNMELLSSSKEWHPIWLSTNTTGIFNHSPQGRHYLIECPFLLLHEIMISPRMANRLIGGRDFVKMSARLESVFSLKIICIPDATHSLTLW